MHSIVFKKLSIWKSEYAISVDELNSGSASFSDLLRNRLVVEINTEKWLIRRKGFWRSHLIIEHKDQTFELPLDWKYRCSINLGPEKYDFCFEGFFKQTLVWTNSSGVRVVICEKPSSFYITCNFQILDNRMEDGDIKLLSIISFYLYLSKLKAAAAAIS